MRRLFQAPAGESSKPRIKSRSRSSIPNSRVHPLNREDATVTFSRNTTSKIPDFNQNHSNPTKPKISGSNVTPEGPRSGPPPRTPTPIAIPGPTLKFGIGNILQHNRNPGNSVGRVRFDELLAEEETRLKHSKAKGHDEELKLLIAPKVSKIPEFSHGHGHRLATPPSKKIRIPKEYMNDRGESIEDDLEAEIYNYVVPSEESVTSHGDADSAYNLKGSTTTTNAKTNIVEIKPIKLKPKRPKTITSGYPFELHPPPFPPSPLAAKPAPTPSGIPKVNRAVNVEKAYKSTTSSTSTESKTPSHSKIVANSSNEPEIPPATSSEQPCNSAVESCAKCTAMAKKWKKEAEMTRTLQRQNGCLEGIITQKRNLAEQLSRQVRVLMKENMQLAKGMQAMNKVLKSDTQIPSDSASATNISATPVKANATPSEPVLQVKTKAKTKNRTGTRPSPSAGRSPKRSVSSRSQSQSENRTPTPTQPRAETAEIRGPRTQQEIASLKSAVDVLQFKLNMSEKDNKEINSFLTDLLYTLNARGYETVTDHRGHTVDLYRCRGEHLLDLKGRDARARMPVKKLVQQENLLKAVIGSQERFIQSLIGQLQDKQKDALVGKRLTSSGEPSSSSNQNSEERSAAMEQEIFVLINLLESACQGNPDVYHALKEEQQATVLTTGTGNQIIEAVMDRYERLVTPPHHRTRNRNNNFSSRSDTPPPPSRRRATQADPRPRDNIVHIRDNPYANNPSNSQASGNRFTENLSLLNLQKNAYGPLPGSQKNSFGPIPARSSSRRSTIPFTTDRHTRNASLRPATTSTNFLAFPPDTLAHFRSNSAHSSTRSAQARPATTMVDGSSKRHSSTIPTKCTFCGEKFPSHLTLAEINEHIDLHVLSEDNKQ